MKSNLIKILKIVIPLGIGVYLTWFFYDGLKDKEKEAIPLAFSNANYFWIILSLAIAWLSHFSRAYRWKYMLEPLGYKPKLSSLYHSVMIGYIINLTVPRSGEFARAGFFAKKENIPFEKSFGTIVAERVIDVVMLLGVFFITSLLVGPDALSDLSKPVFEKEIIISQTLIDNLSLEQQDGKNAYKITNDVGEFKRGDLITHINNQDIYDKTMFGIFINEKVLLKGEPAKKTGMLLYIIIAGLFFLGIITLVLFKKLRVIVIEKLKGVWQGIKSVFLLKKRGLFILHTLFIWTSYVLMFWVCGMGVEGVGSMKLETTFLCFTVGAVAIAATPGGIGLYPILVSGALIYFGYDEGTAAGFSILMWVVQTILLIACGLYSLFAINVKFSAAEVDKDKLTT